ncbi:OmpA family protein [Muricoccus radiodurans]|uniref:OmpA family protein n=1 Tax=Muricoccus radiodurans TaxID=2231721 RepID=UPI003CF68953
MRVVLAVLAFGWLAAAPALAQVTPEARALIERFGDAPPPAAAPGGAVSPGAATRGVAPDTRGIRPPSPYLAVPPPGVMRPPLMTEQSTAPRGVVGVSIFVHFATGSSALSEEARAQLSHLGMALASSELSKFRFLIEGHADRVGSAMTNQVLSVQRAEAVRDYLVMTYRIAPDRLMTAGRGESDPIVPTPDEVAEWRNRRVQVLKMG